jgi:hypothetical protein
MVHRKFAMVLWTILGAISLVVGQSSTTHAQEIAVQSFDRDELTLAQNQPPTPPAPLPNPTQTAPRPNPTATAQARPTQPQQPPTNRYSLSSMPYMIGDAFGGGTQTVTVTTGRIGAPIGEKKLITKFEVPRGNGGGSVGQTRLVEGFSPMPQDRGFLNYSFFNAVPLTQTGINVNRFTPGFEKTFLDGDASIEFRTPMAATLDSTISGSGGTIVNHAEFGDLFTSLKLLILQNERSAITGGLSLTAPTADDVRLIDVQGSNLQELRIHNNAVHLQPYLAFISAPNERYFFQSLFQVDVPTSGNRVTGNFAGLPEAEFGSLTNQVYCNVSVCAGYWLYQGRNDRWITGVAPLIETHYSQTLSRANSITATDGNAGAGGNTSTFDLGNRDYQFQLLNMTVGANVQIGPATTMLLGYSTPLGGGSDRQFNGEFRLFLNRRFGPTSGLPRITF